MDIVKTMIKNPKIDYLKELINKTQNKECRDFLTNEFETIFEEEKRDCQLRCDISGKIYGLLKNFKDIEILHHMSATIVIKKDKKLFEISVKKL